MLPAKPRRGGSSCRSSVVAAVFICLAVVFTLLWPHFIHPAPLAQRATGSDTLVVYVYRQIDAQASDNLAYFLSKVGLGADAAHYVIALDPRLGEKETQLLPDLPPTASYYRPTAICFELGTVGEVIFDSGLVSHSRFKYFVWADSRVRGPFLPSYVQEPWHTHLTAQLRGSLKLFGGTISCAGLKTATDPNGWQQTPHVQGHLMATDQHGLKLLRSAGVFTCHQDWAANVRQGEREASATLLAKGFNIGCLMARYQGLDWREGSKWGCNAMVDPLLEGRYDGSSLQPYEVMFVPVEEALLTMETHAASQAVALTRWEQADLSTGSSEVKTNAWKSGIPGSLLRLKDKGLACFDAEYYIHASPTEFASFTPDQAWSHFLEFGYREGRVHRMVC